MTLMRWLLGGLLLSVAFVALSQIEPTRRVAASSCYLIKVSEAERRSLDPYFDPFAVKHGLSADKGDPGHTEYQSSDQGVLIAIDPFLGSYGAMVALFADALPTNCPLCASFNSYMDSEIGKQFEMSPCSATKGFKVPELLNSELRHSSRQH